MAGALVAFRALRPDRRITGFWPIAIMVLALILAVGYGTILVSFLAVAVAGIWLILLRRGCCAA